MALTVHFEVLNQLGTPMMHSATLANRPAAGIAGRIFFRTDSPYGIFRDTGSAWDQISGASTFSGSLAAGQVAYGSATDTIAGNNNLFWDAANFRLGINTTSPIRSLDIRGAARIETAATTELDLIGSGGNIVRLSCSASGPFIGTLTNVPLGFFTNANKRGEVSINGNFILQSGGTFVDAGQKLQVIGDTFFKGSGNTSATTALTIQNSDAISMFRINNAGSLLIGTAAPRIYPMDKATTSLSLTGAGLSFFDTNTGSGNTFYFTGSDYIHTSGTAILLNATRLFWPTSGTGTLVMCNITPNINQTGGSNGITRGLYVNPTLTAAADWRSIEWSNNTGFGLYGAGTAANYLGGSLGIKTTAIYSPSTFSLDVNGGLLIKNTAGTTAQLTLINADPSVGGNNGFLVNSVGGTSGSSYVDLQGYYGTSITGSTALRLNPAGGPIIVNSTTNSGEQFQLTGTLRINGQQSATASGNSGQHLIINLDGTTYKIKLELP